MGDLGVGKTSLIKQYVFKTFGESITSKFISKESLKYLQFSGKGGLGSLNVRLSIKDIGLIRHPKDIENKIFEPVDGILLVCDLSNPESFYSYDQWIDSISEMPSLNAIALAGNKVDLPLRERELDVMEIQRYAEKLKTEAFITSAKTGENVPEAFTMIAKKCLEAELGTDTETKTSSVSDSGGASRTGRTGWVGTYKSPSAPAAAKPEMTQAQRNLLEMRAKYQHKRGGKGGSDYVDSEGYVHLKYGGYCYLIKEEKAEKSLFAYSEMLEEGYDGLCIARQFPDEIREIYEVGETPIYWLTRSGTERTHLSVNLSRISSFIKKYLDENEKPVLVLEGLEYLIIQNDFMSVLKFIQLVNEYIRMKRACFILPINPDILDSKDLSLLEREMVVIEA